MIQMLGKFITGMKSLIHYHWKTQNFEIFIQLVCWDLQNDDKIHGEPEEVHTGQRAEGTIMSIVVGVGGFGSMGGTRKGSQDQGIVSWYIPSKSGGRALPP